MNLMQRVEAMDPQEVARRPEVRDLWDKGLLWALAHRRSHKYPLGVPMPKDTFFEHQPKEPVPLNEVELALLCWAAAGSNGLILNDMSFTQGACTHPWFEGRVYPSPCNVWYTHLVFNHDDGIFLYQPHVPTRLVEIEGQNDMEVIFRAFKDGLVQLSQESIRLSDDSPATKPITAPFVFKPGVTTFFPIVDVTFEMLNLYLLMVDDEKMRIMDDDLQKPAGIKRWIDSGYLTGHTLALSDFEPRILAAIYGIAAYMQQNLQLCAAILGLGGFPYSGVYSLVLLGGTPAMRGLGFRFSSDKRGYPFPVGLDGHIEPHMPPYMSMDEAIEDVWNTKYKPGYGRYSPLVKEGDRVMYRGFDPNPRAVHRPFQDPDNYTKAARLQSSESIEVAKAVANYVYETYGRFPKIIDPIFCPTQVQVSHIDVDLYDKYYLPGTLWQELREHLKAWHR